MPQISYSGTLNSASIVVPDLYIQIVPPTVLSINGIPTNIVGVVGSAPYGPVGQAVVFGTLSDYQSVFGGVVARKFDMGTHVNTAIQQGAAAFAGVRVTDGTDTAAFAIAQTVGGVISPSFVAPFTGSGGGGTTVSIVPGRAAGTWAAVVTRQGQIAQAFDPGATTWGQIVNAINNGIPTQNQPASSFVVAVAGNATLNGTPSALTFLLGSGTDGAAGVGTVQMLGTDGLVTTGAYGLRGQGCSVALCADLDDTTAWPALDALAQSEGIYWQHAYPSGSSISTSATTQPTLGLSSWSKALHGDWLYWYDETNGATRLVSPQGFSAGKLASLGPQQSGLNKQMAGIVGSYFTGQNGGNAYSDAQLKALFALNIDLITSPSPGGSYWSLRLGHNSSTSLSTSSDVYPRMTAFLARSLAAGMGLYVGQPITATLYVNIKSTLLSFLSNLLSQGILAQTTTSLPYAVVCDASNNPFSRTSLGYVQADVQVQYPGVNEKFLVNLEGGQGVTVSTQSNT